MELYEFQSNLGLDIDMDLPDFKIPESKLEDLKHPEVIEDLRQGDLSWQEIKSMPGLEFEGFVERLFDEMGYDAWQTKKSGDQGADVIAEKVGEKVAVQAKNKSSKVSNSAIQEVKAALDHYNCNKGIVVSTSEYTQSARDLAGSNNIELWSKQEILNKKQKFVDLNRLT